MFRRQRASAIIIQNNKILLIHRIKKDDDYFVFPGGGIEEGESREEAMAREIKEELNLEVRSMKLVFELDNKSQKNQHEFFFLIKDFSGIPVVGGPEREIMNEQNQYVPVWVELEKVADLANLFPTEAKIKVKQVC